VTSQMKAKIKALRGELDSQNADNGIGSKTMIGLAVSAIERAINKELKKKWGLTHAEYIVLHALIDHGGSITLSQLTSKVLFTRQAIAMTARALEKRGLIAREAVKNDRRKIRLTLTEAGFEFIKSILLSPQRKGFHETLVSYLTEDEVNSMLVIFDKMVKGLKRKKLFN